MSTAAVKGFVSGTHRAMPPEETLAALRRLPAGRTFENLYDAFETLFGPLEETRESPQRDG